MVKLFRLLIVLLILGVIGFFIAYRTYKSRIEKPLSDSSQNIDFSIEDGSSINIVIQNLIEVGLLDDSDQIFLKIYLKLNKLDSTIQAGEYSIPQNLDMIQLIRTLQNGQIKSIWVTFPEGMRADEYADTLVQAFSELETSQFSKDKFMNLIVDKNFIDSINLPFETETLEGSLFPDKYLLPEAITEEEIIITMTDNFKSKITDTTYEQLIIASLLEREGRTEEERYYIADIIQRRFNEGWFLNIDATLLYYYKDWKHEITIEDIETDHDYNTYLRLGFPPTPICNPGLSSINAALDPTPNNYYYYIHDKNGNIHYATTLEEHNANVIQYLQ